MLTYPNISPVAFSIGPLSVHWYGLMYLLGFVIAYFLAKHRRARLGLSLDGISDLVFYCALGIILGGRLGYMLFYNTHQLLVSPWSIVKLWEGGMSFHGGLLGVIVAMILFSRKYQQPFLAVADFVAPLVPVGLAAGRIGNFINGELWGRPTDVPWGMVFPMADVLPRHPSQLYEFLLEGVLLFIVLWWYSEKPRPLGRVSALFLIVYSLGRLLVECFREPDVQLGFMMFDTLTMGQLLCIPMLIAGLIIWWKAK